MAKISDLSTLSSLEMNDLLLVSRLVGTINKQDNVLKKYISFNIDAASLTTQSCGAIYAKLENDYIQPLYNSTNYVLNEISDKYNKHVATLNLHISKCNDILNTLNNLSSTLSDEQNDFKNHLTATFTSLSNDLSTKIKDLLNGINNNINITSASMSSTLSSDLTSLYNQITTYISNNCVLLTGNQFISGTKTFTNPIHGMALSSKWN